MVLVDKDILTQYCDLQEEERDLRQRICRLEDQISHLSIVSDSVTGTRKDGIIGKIRITGYPTPEYYRKLGLLRRRKAAMEETQQRLLGMLNEVEAFVDGIEDSRLRRIFRYRYVDNMSWLQVAIQMGGKHTADSCRNAHDRYLGLKK